MIPASLTQVADVLQARPIGPLEGSTVTSVSTDSRTAAPGALFFAIRGERFDGHDFIADAFARGAVACVVQREAAGGAAARCAAANTTPRSPLLVVGDTVEALGRLAAWHRHRLPATVIAVTGSNGKTTVKAMLDHVLAGALCGRAARGSFNNHIGVPLTLLSAAAGDQYLVVEIGTNRCGEVAALGRLAEPDVAVITSVAPAHLEGLGTLDAVRAEKGSLLSCLRPGGAAVVHRDVLPAFGTAWRAAGGTGPPTVRHAAAPLGEVITFAAEPPADLFLTRVAQHPDGVEFETSDGLRVRLRLPGRHNAVNALAVVAVARRLGLPDALIAARLEEFTGPPMRLERMRIGPWDVLLDAYNANPASTKAAIDVLASLPAAGRRVAIIGDMLELGPQAAAYHRQVGAHAAGARLDLLLTVGGLAWHLWEAAGDALPGRAFAGTGELLEAVGEWLEPGDLILIKGSRRLALEQVAQALRALAADAASGHGQTGSACASAPARRSR